MNRLRRVNGQFATPQQAIEDFESEKTRHKAEIDKLTPEQMTKLERWCRAEFIVRKINKTGVNLVFGNFTNSEVIDFWDAEMLNSFTDEDLLLCSLLTTKMEVRQENES